MTWGNLKNACLGLMFSNVNGTSPVSTSDASVQEYVLNMPDSARFGFADLSTVCPKVTIKTIPFSNIVQNEIDLTSVDYFGQSFIRLLDNEAMVLEDGNYTKFCDFFHLENEKIVLTDIPQSGSLILSAVVYPIYPTSQTLDSVDIDYPEKGLTAVYYYMAHRLYMEDDISIAMHYLNYYQSLKEELKEEYKRNNYGLDEFTNKAGWL